MHSLNLTKSVDPEPEMVVLQAKAVFEVGGSVPKGPRNSSVPSINIVGDLKDQGSENLRLENIKISVYEDCVALK